MKHTLLKIILTLIGIFFCTTVYTANKSEWNMEKLCKFSDCIIVGVVENSEYSISPTTGFPMTLITIKITSTLKGSPGTSLTVRIPGGRKNGKTRIIMGMPSFGCKEEVFLFLKKTPSSASQYYGVSGLSDGKYSIQIDPNTKQKMAFTNSEVEAISVLQGKRASFSLPQDGSGIPVNELIRQISQIVSGVKGGK